MATCSSCYGIGYHEDYEDGRYFQEDCYHCRGTGEVDQHTAYLDKLEQVIYALASRHLNQVISDYNSNPDGEGWSFGAAESMMTDSEYYQYHLNNYIEDFAKRLVEMSQQDQQLLIAWNEMPVEHKTFTKVSMCEITPVVNEVATDDVMCNHIPF